MLNQVAFLYLQLLKSLNLSLWESQVIFGKLKDLSCSYGIANSVYRFKTYSDGKNMPVSKILMGASLNARPKFTLFIIIKPVDYEQRIKIEHDIQGIIYFIMAKRTWL